MSTSRGLSESGAVSGNAAHFLFSDGDVRESDADIIPRPALGKFAFPNSIMLCEIQQLGLFCSSISTA